ncbi:MULTISPECIES: hypothetical protein [Pseudomonas]|uniref:Uncharacterized protein n=1 Tax=Pseudomonas nitroreducens TaxID=46680 RepID=A0A6G6IRM4_PSENT|nr:MULTISPECIES: hypothetical protein [Pseudomonas]NMZ74618.1 hypothetical protein [Pseudomonas nitroreducens]QIE85758.1 hypothetical protein G5B91_05555 [Pseudomonas nitroreducens]UCL88142.1 hypothetical protein LDJ84_05470 [Pseudomonas sp. HS-18]
MKNASHCGAFFIPSDESAQARSYRVVCRFGFLLGAGFRGQSPLLRNSFSAAE